MNSALSIAFMSDDDFGANVGLESTIFPRFSAPGRLPIFEVFGGALIKTYENLDLPLPAHIRTVFYNFDN